MRRGLWLSERRLFYLAAAILALDVLVLVVSAVQAQGFSSVDTTELFLTFLFALLLYRFRRRRDEPIGSNFAM